MKNIFIIMLSFTFLSCSGQINSLDTLSYSKTIKNQAKKMGKLFLKRDLKSFIKYSYPKIVKMAGGKKKMIEILDQGLKEMETEGIGFLNVTFGQPSKVIAKENELQCTLQQTIEMKVPDGRLFTTSTLIAVSMDQGKNWFFIDTSGKGILTMKKSLPNLSGYLEIPEKQQPIFFKD